MSTKLSVHISAFNSDIYQAEIAKLFPELETTISKGRARHEGSFNCDILIGWNKRLIYELRAYSVQGVSKT